MATNPPAGAAGQNWGIQDQFVAGETSYIITGLTIQDSPQRQVLTDQNGATVGAIHYDTATTATLTIAGPVATLPTSTTPAGSMTHRLKGAISAKGTILTLRGQLYVIQDISENGQSAGMTSFTLNLARWENYPTSADITAYPELPDAGSLTIDVANDA